MKKFLAWDFFPLWNLIRVQLASKQHEMGEKRNLTAKKNLLPPNEGSNFQSSWDKFAKWLAAATNPAAFSPAKYILLQA